MKSLWGHVFAFFLGKYLGVKLLGCMENVCLIFHINCQMFSKVVFIYRIGMYWNILHSHPLCMIVLTSTSSPTLGIVYLFYYSPSSGYGVRVFCTKRIYSSFQSLRNRIKTTNPHPRISFAEWSQRTKFFKIQGLV